MSFIYGVIGTLAVMILFFGGVLVGYKLRGKVEAYRRPETAGPNEEELQRLKDQQKAFAEMQNYSVEMAYGQVRDPYGVEGSDEI